MKILCIYGCGGIGREIAELACNMKKWKNVIFIDDNLTKNIINNIKVYSLKEVIDNFNKSEIEFIVSVGEPRIRELLYSKIDQHKLNYTSLIIPNSNISAYAEISQGTIVHTNSIISCNTTINKGCLINKRSIIAHDAIIGQFSVISPNVTIGGNVNIGNNCYIGSGAIIRNGINIGNYSIIGMGAVVTRSIEPESVYIGNPARFIRKNLDRTVFR